MHLNAAQDEESKNFRRCWGEEKKCIICMSSMGKNYSKVFRFGSFNSSYIKFDLNNGLISLIFTLY